MHLPLSQLFSLLVQNLSSKWIVPIGNMPIDHAANLRRWQMASSVVLCTRRAHLCAHVMLPHYATGTFQVRRQLLRSGGGLTSTGPPEAICGWSGPCSSLSVVKLLIICAREARGKILDLASYLVVRRRSHCTSTSNWELPLLCYPTLQGTSSLIKS